MKFHFNSYNHAGTCVVLVVHGFGSATFTDITTCVAGNFYSSYWDGPGASYRYSAVFFLFYDV